VLAYDHNNLVHEKLAPLEAFLDLNAAELKKKQDRAPDTYCVQLQPRQPCGGEYRPAASTPGAD
jgi:hypothetical protein